MNKGAYVSIVDPASINIFRTADFFQGLILSCKPHVTDRVMGVRVTWNVSKGGRGKTRSRERGEAKRITRGGNSKNLPIFIAFLTHFFLNSDKKKLIFF